MMLYSKSDLIYNIIDNQLISYSAYTKILSINNITNITGSQYILHKFNRIKDLFTEVFLQIYDFFQFFSAQRKNSIIKNPFINKKSIFLIIKI